MWNIFCLFEVYSACFCTVPVVSWPRYVQNIMDLHAHTPSCFYHLDEKLFVKNDGIKNIHPSWTNVFNAVIGAVTACCQPRKKKKKGCILFPDKFHVFGDRELRWHITIRLILVWSKYASMATECNYGTRTLWMWKTSWRSCSPRNKSLFPAY